MSSEKEKHNHTGQTPSDIPSEKLKHPPKKRSGKVSQKKDSSTIAKDPNLGSRNSTGR